MVTNERHRVAEAAELRDDVGAVARVALDHVVLGGRQCPRLSEDGVRHADLADVVEQAPVTEGFATLIRYPELVCHGERDALHARRMSRCVGIARVHRCVEARDRLERSFLEPAIRLQKLARACA